MYIDCKRTIRLKLKGKSPATGVKYVWHVRGCVCVSLYICYVHMATLDNCLSATYII